MIKKLIFKKELVILISIIFMILSISAISANEDLITLDENVETNDFLINDITEENSNEKFTLTSENLTMNYKDGSRYSTILQDENGTFISNKTIEFNINDVKYNKTTDLNGTAYITINLNPGNYTIISTYFTSTNNFTCNSTVNVLSTIAADNLFKYFLNDTQFYASFYDGTTPITNTNVTFNINGVFYTRQTNDEGIARLAINLNPNNYILTAEHPLNGLQMSYNITVLPTLSGDDLVKYYLNASQYHTSILDENGNPLVNKSVTMNINGVFYDRITNSDGIATLSINLNPNNYIITVYHPENGLLHSNNIEVLSTLICQNLKYEYNYPKSFYVKVLDKQGNPNPNGVVKVSVGGKSLEKVADENGTVIFNITARSGVYDILTTYDGYTVSNLLEVYRDVGGFERVNLGANSNGSVSIIKSIGNVESDIKIAYIIGVHPSENAVHQAVYDLLLANSNELSYCYDIYKIDVIDDGDYSTGRMKGQLLAQDFAVPEIISSKYNLVIDVHSNEGTVGGNYLHTNFAFAPLQDAISVKYSDKIIYDNPGLVQYFPASQTSPEYVTLPIAESGIPTVIYETYKFESSSITTDYAGKLIKSVDTIDFN